MMGPMTLGAFALSFVGGPLLCALLLRLPQKLWALGLLAAGVVVTVTLALSYQLRGPDAQLTSLLLLWLAWVLAIAMVAHAIRPRFDTARGRRWLTICAVFATTLPWFGLATAGMMN